MIYMGYPLVRVSTYHSFPIKLHCYVIFLGMVSLYHLSPNGDDFLGRGEPMDLDGF